MKILLLVITLSTAAPAIAMQINISQFNDEQKIFLTSHHKELSLLSRQEMKETEGSVLPIGLIMVGSATVSGVNYYFTAKNPNVGGALVAMGTGAVTSLGIPGKGIAYFGNLYAKQITSGGPMSTTTNCGGLFPWC